jgi:spore coat polysaccharide biosynthesis protein SpsF (cytidylyltransferase family)
MRIVAIVQARMQSSRLPGKVLEDVAGRTMLARVVERVRRAEGIAEVVVATTTSACDDPIVAECARLAAPVFRGSETDVLDRYRGASEEHAADAVVRITSDCPLADPGIIDRVIRSFQKNAADYAYVLVERACPRGLDAEVIARPALELAWRQARSPSDREHVTPFIRNQPEMFRVLTISSPADYSGYRWTVDTADDLRFVRAVYERLGADGRFGWRDVLDLLRREPALAEINRHVPQKRLAG